MSERTMCPPSHAHAKNGVCRSIHGCKCLPCTDRARRYENWRSRQGGLLVPAVGTHRRIQALARLGWSGRELAERLGKSRRYVSRLLAQEQVSRKTAAAIRRLYDELSMTIPPETNGVARCRSHAIRQGWLPPLAWDDETIDDPGARPAETGEAA